MEYKNNAISKLIDDFNNNNANIIFSINEVMNIIIQKCEFLLNNNKFNKPVFENLILFITTFNNIIVIDNLIKKYGKLLIKNIDSFDEDFDKIIIKFKDYSYKILNEVKILETSLIYFDKIKLKEEKELTSKIKNLEIVAVTFKNIVNINEKYVDKIISMAKKKTNQKIKIGGFDKMPLVYYTPGKRIKYLINEKKNMFNYLNDNGFSVENIVDIMKRKCNVDCFKKMSTMLPLEYFRQMLRQYNVFYPLNQQIKNTPMHDILKNLSSSCKYHDTDFNHMHELFNYARESVIKKIKEDADVANVKHIDEGFFKNFIMLLSEINHFVNNIDNTHIDVKNIPQFYQSSTPNIEHVLFLEQQLMPRIIETEKEIVTFAERFRDLYKKYKNFDFNNYVVAMKNKYPPKQRTKKNLIRVI
jgi:hypothetical protein